MNAKMNTCKFRAFVDNLVNKYKNAVDNEMYDGTCTDFVIKEVGSVTDFNMRVNPLDVIRELNDCNIGFTDAYYQFRFTDRFKVLKGIMTIIEFVNRPQPKFKSGDIVIKNDSTEVLRINEIYDNKYIYTIVNSNEDDSNFIDDIDINYYKIGEAKQE